MQSTTLFFNKALHRSDWRRFWPLPFFYTAAWAVALPLTLWSSTSRIEETDAKLSHIQNLLYSEMSGAAIVSIFMGLLLAMALFGYLMRPSSVGLMHALPVSRGTQFATHFLTGVEMFTVCNVLLALLALLAQSGCGVVAMSATLCWLLSAELTCLFYFSFATLCAMLTGWVLAIPVIYAGVNFVCLGVVAVLETMGSVFYFGADSISTPAFAMWLTPILKLFQEVRADSVYLSGNVSEWTLNTNAISTLLIYTAAALVMIAAAYMLYRTRRSEGAGDAIVFDWLKPIVLYVIAIAGGLGLGLVLFEILYLQGLALLLLCQLIMGGICYLAVVMLLRKRFKVMDKKTGIGAVILVAALIAITLCCKYDITGFETRVPAASDIESVRVDTAAVTYGTTLTDPESIEKAVALHQTIVDAYKAGTIDKDGLSDRLSAKPDNYFGIDLFYTMTDGSTMKRYYYVPVMQGSDIHTAFNAVVNTPAVRQQQIIHGFDPDALASIRGGYADNYQNGTEIQLTQAQAQAIYAAFTRYIQSNTNTVEVLDDTGRIHANVHIEFDCDDGTYYYAESFPADCTEVMALLVEYGLADDPGELVYEDNGDTILADEPFLVD